MWKEELNGKKKSSYWWTIILIIIIGFWIYVYNQPDEDVTFVVKSGYWLTCWEDASNMTISYDLSSSLAVDLLFTPTREDAENLTATSKHYASCYISNVLENKGSCVIAGKGCIVLLNKNVDDATVSLKYSAKRI
jgi:hypothetical protein